MTVLTTLIISNFFSLESYSHAALFEGCQYPWQALERLENYLRSQELGKQEGEVSPLAHLIHPSAISIGSGTVVEPGAYIQGPCIIGKNCTIRHGAYIRGNVVIGDNCVIGHDTELKHAIFCDHSSAAHFNYVGDSILGRGVNLGAGVKCANLRLDQNTISIFIQGEKIDTGLKKLGSIIGDAAQVGCNCVLNPGTLLGRNSFCFPCLNVCGFVPENAKVKPAMRNIME